MTSPAVPPHKNEPSTPAQAGASDPVMVGGLEDQFLEAWNRHRGLLIGIGALLVAGAIGFYAWTAISSRKDAAVSREFSLAKTPAQLRAVIASRSGHPLVPMAQLRLADQLYTDGQYTEAVAAYEQAASSFGSGPFAARARLGSAVSRLTGGQAPAGEAALRQISSDTGAPVGVRVEAIYHLANIAAGAGKAEEVAKLSDELIQLDSGSVWAQRGLLLRSRVPVAAPAATPGLPAMPGLPPLK